MNLNAGATAVPRKSVNTVARFEPSAKEPSAASGTLNTTCAPTIGPVLTSWTCTENWRSLFEIAATPAPSGTTEMFRPVGACPTATRTENGEPSNVARMIVRDFEKTPDRIFLISIRLRGELAGSAELCVGRGSEANEKYIPRCQRRGRSTLAG